jgi:hypothetical protein
MIGLSGFNAYRMEASILNPSQARTVDRRYRHLVATLDPPLASSSSTTLTTPSLGKQRTPEQTRSVLNSFISPRAEFYG